MVAPSAWSRPDPERIGGCGYYVTGCFRSSAADIEGPAQLADGGSVDWGARLQSHGRESMANSGAGAAYPGSKFMSSFLVIRRCKAASPWLLMQYIVGPDCGLGADPRIDWFTLPRPGGSRQTGSVTPPKQPGWHGYSHLRKGALSSSAEGCRLLGGRRRLLRSEMGWVRVSSLTFGIKSLRQSAVRNAPIMKASYVALPGSGRGFTHWSRVFYRRNALGRCGRLAAGLDNVTRAEATEHSARLIRTLMTTGAHQWSHNPINVGMCADHDFRAAGTDLRLVDQSHRHRK